MSNFDINEETSNDNTIIELNTMDEETGAMDASAVKEISDTELKVKPIPKREEIHKPNKNKKSIKEKWESLSKGKKIAVIVTPIVIVLITAAILLYFLVLKKDDDKKLDPEENVTIEKENYKYQNGSLILLDENDKELGKYECKDKDVEKCYVASLSNEDDFDVQEYRNTKGEKVVRTSKIILGRFVFIYDDKKISLYDMKSKETNGEYELIKTGNIEKNYVVVKEKSGKYGILSFTSSSYEELIKPSYEYLGIASDEKLFIAKEGNQSFLIDDTDKTVSAKLNGNIRNFDNKYISLYAGEKYALYDYKGTLLIQDNEMEYIDFKDSYIFIIRDGRIYPYDDTLYKLTETGVKLKGEEYRPIYVFDDKNNYKETKSAYKLSTSDGKIIIETNGKEKEINVYEGMLNKQIPYINYFDGSLFFYSDNEKTDLIGSYTCTNKNDVSSTTKTLDNCYIAKASNIINNIQTEGYIPIINKKYVFVYDTSSSEKNPRIVISDIENAKTLGTYQKVDITTRTAEISHIANLDELVYAQNTSGKYGVVKIDANTASKKLNFDYSKLSFLKNDYIIAQDEFYRLFKIDDLAPENEIIRSKFPIVDYSYGNFVVNKSNKYIVYNSEGGIVVSDLDYVKLESDYLTGVKNSRLNLYPYERDANPLLKEGIDLGNNYDSITTISNNGYQITIKSKDGKETNYYYDRSGNKIDKPGNGDSNSEEE